MSTNDDAQHSDRQPTTPSAKRRIAFGGVGLAVLLGGGAYLITTQLADGEGTTAAPDSGAIQQVPSATPVVPSSVPALAPEVTADAVDPSPASTTPSPEKTANSASSPRKTENSAAVRREIDRARAEAAKDGHPVQRPLRQKAEALDPNKISTRTETTAEGTIRISAAKGDLSGQEDQLLAADDGKPVGNARCTQKVHFSADAPAREIPTLLLCWRTSADRSVVTLAVSKKGVPSSAASVATIDREWAKLG